MPITRTVRVAPVMLRKWKASFRTAVKLPKFGPKLFGMTVPSMMARPGSDWIAAHAARSSAYIGSRDWGGNSGVQLDDTPINELQDWTRDRFGFVAIRSRA